MICKFRPCSNLSRFSSLRIPHLQPLSTVSTAPQETRSRSPLTPGIDHGREKWDIWAGVCLERRPVITADLNPLEKKYRSFLNKFELQNSHLADHELRHFKDKDILEKLKRGEIEKGTVQTAQDFEDLSNSEYDAFKFASRITEADQKNDTKSLERALDSYLLLVIDQKLDQNESKWVCPQGKLNPGESLRSAAERILTEFCPDIRARFYGNAPWGFYKYKYPKNIREKEAEDRVVGAKIFFMKAQFLGGNLDPSKSKLIKDYLWLTRDEMEVKLHEGYCKELTKFLIYDYDSKQLRDE